MNLNVKDQALNLERDKRMTRSDAACVADEAMAGLSEFETLLSSGPDLNDLTAMHEWMTQVHAMFAYWTSEEARLEAIFCRFYAAMLDSGQIKETTFKAIKHSSTMTDRYMAGNLPEIYQAWQRCKGLLNVCSKILDDVRTMLVTHRERTRVEKYNIE